LACRGIWTGNRRRFSLCMRRHWLPQTRAAAQAYRQLQQYHLLPTPPLTSALHCQLQGRPTRFGYTGPPSMVPISENSRMTPSRVSYYLELSSRMPSSSSCPITTWLRPAVTSFLWPRPISTVHKASATEWCSPRVPKLPTAQIQIPKLQTMKKWSALWQTPC
jgi:hypothetical protein